MTPEATDPIGTGELRLTRYRDVRAALAEPRLVIHKPLGGDRSSHLLRVQQGHERSRRIRPLSRVLSEQLSPRAIQPLMARIEEILNDILTAALARGSMDVVADLAFPLPLAVMMELLGLPGQGHAQLRPLFEAITHGHDMGSTVRDQQQAHLALATITRWLAPLVRQRRPSPFMDAILKVVKAQAIDESVFLYWCAMLLYAGSATTKDLISNAVARLLEVPSAAQQLAADPSIMDTAIEEFLRFDGPIRGIGRVAMEDIVLGDCEIGRGQLVYLMLGAANRDPEHFPAPDTLDLKRTPNPHLAFGLGITHCLGSHLARMETRIVLGGLLKFLPRMTVRHSAQWSDVRLLSERASLEVAIR